MVPPPAKRPRLAASSVASGITHRTTRSQKPRLSPELLAKVASFAQVGNDLMNLCIVAGPKDCAIIRHAYLYGNGYYLENSLRSYVTNEAKVARATRRASCHDRYSAWMLVNSDWRKYASAEGIERSKQIVICRGTRRTSASLHPLFPFNNPAVAIELGLMDPLKHLVEELEIDINSYWNTYNVPGTQRYHLLASCVRSKNIEAFRYLLGQPGVDIHYEVGIDDSACIGLTISKMAFLHSHCTDYFREILGHPGFDFVDGFTSSDTASPPLHFAIRKLCPQRYKTFDLATWKANFHLLLTAGADPYQIHRGIDAIQCAKERYRMYADCQGLKDAVEILEDWVATTSM